MCCGSKRLDAARNAAPAYAQAAPRTPRETAGPAALSGPTDSAAAAAMAAAVQRGARGSAVFVHDGAGELVVTGKSTGRRYRFTGRGARVAVDALDAPALAMLDKLRRLA